MRRESICDHQLPILAPEIGGRRVYAAIGLLEPLRARGGEPVETSAPDTSCDQPALAREAKNAGPGRSLVDSEGFEQADKTWQHHRAAMRGNGIAPDRYRQRRRPRR